VRSRVPGGEVLRIGGLIMVRMPALMILFALIITPAAAADFCVSTSAELQNALTQAQGNAQDNQIRIVKGTYHTADNGNPDLGFIYANSMPGGLTISGGWLPNCKPSRFRSSAYETVLDGGDADRVLAIAAGEDNVAISIMNMTIQSGIAPLTDNIAGGLLVEGFGAGDEAGTVSIDRVVFTGNQANYASALSVDSYDRVDITNSLFNNNTVNISTTARIRRNTNSSQASYFINNTVVNNIRLGDNGTSGVLLQKSGSVGNVAANNVMWNNVSWDIQFSGNSANQHLLFNTVQNVINNAGIDVGNSNANPLLDSDFSLQPGSPAIDAGVESSSGIPNLPPGLNWSLSDFDVAGFLRVSGVAVDMGAFELQDSLFLDSFE